MIRLCVSLAATVLLTPVPAQETPAGQPAPERLTVEHLFADPPMEGLPPRDFAFSPKGNRLAFLQDEGRDGPASIWLYDIETRTRCLLLSPEALPPREPPEEASDETEEPERHRIGSFLWAPGGDALAVLSKEGDLFLVEVPGGRLRRLTDTEEPESHPDFSPDGEWLAFVREHDLHLLSLLDGEERALTTEGSEELYFGEADWVTCEELRLCRAYWWSPDAATVALMRFDLAEVPRHPLTDWGSLEPEVIWQHYPTPGGKNARVTLGLISRDGGAVRWIETGAAPDDYLARVDWTADGSALLVQRLNRQQDRLTLERIDPSGEGEPATVLEETDNPWINLTGDTQFLEDGRILWSSERDGWRHLYLYGADGRLLRRLTEGPWMVTGVSAVDEAGGWVYFTATEKDVRERHLYRVGLDGTEPTRITTDDGTHEVTFDEEGQVWVDRHSRTDRIWTTILRRADGAPVEDLDPQAGTGLGRLVHPRHEFLTLTAGDGTPLMAQFLRPADFDPAHRYPVLVYVYGGPHAQVVRDRWDGVRYLWHTLMTRHGYLVFSLDNRGSHGRGRSFEAAVAGRLGHLELEDQLTGVRYLKTLPYVDPDRIGIWGWSYGGTMTLNALTTTPGIFRAGVAVAPVADWTLYDSTYTERYMGTPEDNPEGYRESSPLERAGLLEGAVLLAHGTADDNVHLQNSMKLIEALVDHDVPHELQLYPGQSHSIRATEARRHLFRRITRFLLDNL